MTRQLDPRRQEAANLLQDPDPDIWLYEIELPTDPQTRIRATSYKTQVIFDTDSSGASLIYRPASITHTPIEQGRAGDLPTVRVTVGNIAKVFDTDKTIGEIVNEHGGLKGAPARIIAVRADTLLDPTARVQFDFQVVRVRVTTQACTFELRHENLMKAKIPRWRYLSRGCRFNFGGPRCGYQIPSSPGETIGTGFGSCDKTESDCDIRGQDEDARGITVRHPLRYGGFPGLDGL